MDKTVYLIVETANLEIVVRTNNEERAYFGTSQSEEAIATEGVFLNEENGFIVENRNFYEIYHGESTYNFLPNITFNRSGTPRTIRRRLSKVLNTLSTEVVYFYYDNHDNEHELCRRDIILVSNKTREATIPLVPQRGNLINTIDFRENRNLGEDIDAVRLEVYANGTLGVHKGNDRTKDKWYANQPGTSQLVNMEHLNTPLPQVRTEQNIFQEFDYQLNGINIRYGFVDTRRRHTRVDVYAGFLGAIIQFRLEGHQHYIVSNGFTYEDNSCHPSSEHTNGRAGDLCYLSTLGNGSYTLLGEADFDYDNQVILCNILIDYGFQRSCSERFSNRLNTSTSDNNTTLLPNAIHVDNPPHNNHLHIDRFREIPDIYE